MQEENYGRLSLSTKEAFYKVGVEGRILTRSNSTYFPSKVESTVLGSIRKSYESREVIKTIEYNLNNVNVLSIIEEGGVETSITLKLNYRPSTGFGLTVPCTRI